MGFENLLLGFQVALQPDNVFLAVVGVALGTVIGVLPGLGGANGVAILLPLTFAMPPTSAIILLTSLYWGALFGGATVSLPCGADMAAPGNTALLDASGDGSVNITDAVQLLTHLFQGGPSHILGRECVVIAGCGDACE